ncbi:MAG TPA: hypothetical protein VMS93_06120 [Candidatus Saccharimonadales bacterium]|nr:hypothetical protein [Candidatus Saccharimonadales bacterium]
MARAEPGRRAAALRGAGRSPQDAAPRPPRPGSPRRGLPGWLRHPSPRLAFLAPAVLALVVSLPALRGELVWDDVDLIVHDVFVHHLANVPQAFARSFWAMLRSPVEHFDYYRPLTTVSYMLTYALAGDARVAYHLFNSLVYALTAGLLALMLIRLGAGAGAALAAGLVFAAWPTHVENVDFISGRTDLLAGLFGLAAFALYVRHWQGRGRAGVTLAGLAVCSAAAVLSKETAYALPPALALFEWAGRRTRGAWQRLTAATAPVAGGIAVGLTVASRSAHASWAQPGQLATAFLFNARDLLAPWPPRVGAVQFEDTFTVRVVLLLAGLGALALLCLALLPGRGPRAAWVAGWALVVPSCLTGVPSNRLVYAPSMVLIPLVVWRLSRLPWPAPWRAALAGAVVAAGAAGFVVAGLPWRTQQELFETTVRSNPTSNTARDNLAEYYHYVSSAPSIADSTRTRWLQLSAEHFRVSAILSPRSVKPWLSLARAYFELGQDLRALTAARIGVSLGPNWGGYFMEAQALTRLGRYAQADTAVTLALLHPGGWTDPEPWTLLGWVRFQRGRFEESERASAHALRLSPAASVAAWNRALAWACMGHADSAGAAWRQLLAGDSTGSGAASELSDIAQHGASGGAGAETAARTFLAAAGLLPGAPGAPGRPPAPRLRAALAEAARTWPRLAELAGVERPR